MMEWIIFRSISDLPQNIWDEKISEGHPARSSGFLKALERACNDREFYYFVSYEQNEIVSCCLVTLNDIDGCIFLPVTVSKWVSMIRKGIPRFIVFKVVMTGTLETTGRHWWYNAERISWDQYVGMLFDQIKKHFRDSHTIILRDFLTERAQVPEEIRSPLKARGFRELSNLPLAIVNLNHWTEKDYLRTLKERDRSTIRKVWTIIEKNGLLIEYIDDFGSLIDEMYPLYLAVNRNAKELKTPAMPKKFFKILNEEMPHTSNAIMIRDGNSKQLICFILSLDNSRISNPFFIGMDYKVARQFYLLYTSLWLVICRAMKNRQLIIDLGVTNYFIKQGLGAKLVTMRMFVRFTNPILNILLKPVISVIFQPELPRVRSTKKKIT